LTSRREILIAVPTINCWTKSSAPRSTLSGTKPAAQPDKSGIERGLTAAIIGELPVLRQRALDSPACALGNRAVMGRRRRSGIACGRRVWNCELSSIDTSLLLCGVLTARQHFNDAEIQDLATAIYERVDWPWMLNGGETFSMGWKPQGGFLRSRWEHYCELMMIYLLAIGSPMHSVPSDTWKAWTRPTVKFQEFEYISGNDPLFTHQYSQAWFDFRRKRDAYADYFANSVTATEAHKRFCISLRDEFPDYSLHLWGITSSDSAAGYQAWGGPPRMGRLDGSVVPCAAGGSLPFLQEDCMLVLRTIRECYPKAWGRYGFVDAFNPLTGWYNPDVLGIDLGITMLMAENARSGFVWETFMKNKDAARAMEKAGFKGGGMHS
jgi:hypothetical protein